MAQQKHEKKWKWFFASFKERKLFLSYCTTQRPPENSNGALISLETRKGTAEVVMDVFLPVRLGKSVKTFPIRCTY